MVDLEQSSVTVHFLSSTKRQIENHSAIRWGNYKLVKDWRFNKFELFDLSKDIEEKNDLSIEMPELVEKLNDALTRYLDEANAETKQTET